MLPSGYMAIPAVWCKFLKINEKAWQSSAYLPSAARHCLYQPLYLVLYPAFDGRRLACSCHKKTAYGMRFFVMAAMCLFFG